MRYELTSPSVKSASSHVAEVLAVKDGKIESVSIVFDTAAFNKLMAQE